jgi:trans-aconitate methyltransferase
MDPAQQIQQAQHSLQFNELLLKYSPVHDFLSRYQPASVIDYGCAQGHLMSRIAQDFPSIQRIEGYDPGNPRYQHRPQGVFDCMISCDVIEHFEPDQANSILLSMQQQFTRAAFFIIACYPAKKILADGRNAHLIVEPPEHWLDRIQRVMTQCQVVYQETVMFNPRPDKPKKYGAGRPELRLILERVQGQ